MRVLPLILIILAATASAAEAPYPLWDTVESVADYAKKVNLPPAKTLDLGNGVKLELVLIPAGTFMMGTPEPIPIDEDAFMMRVVIGQAILAISSSVMLVLLATVIIRAVRKYQRPKFSLARLLAMTMVTGIAVGGALHWQLSVRQLGQAKIENKAAKARLFLAYESETPAHPVTITKPFYLGKYAVTQEQFQAVTSSNPSHFKGMDNPVEMVSWYEAQAFCENVTKQTKENLCLPTEAEWEYACRAGTTSMYYSGDADKDLDRVAWSLVNSGRTTHPIGQKQPNAFGLYDMHGNVWQWCRDLWDEYYYMKSPAENPQGPSQGGNRVFRGGSWGDSSAACRSASRCWTAPGSRIYLVGFRVALTPTFRTP